MPCYECSPGNWICQETGTPDCGSIPGGTDRVTGWVLVRCYEDLDAGLYHIWCRPGGDDGKCEAKITDNGNLEGPPWQYRGGVRIDEDAKYGLYCRKGPGTTGPCEVSLVRDCPNP